VATQFPPEGTNPKGTTLKEQTMEHIADLGPDTAGVSPLDPSRYVRQADLALINGDRDEAVALIAQAYLAFDLALAECEQITWWGKVSSGRNS
jgi:hypothetical protein